MTVLLAHLLEIIEEREPTEEETSDLPAVIADDGGDWNRIPITQQQVEILKAKGLIYYCGYCTKTAIEIDADGESEKEPDEYAAREYHTKEALCDVDDPEAYLKIVIARSYQAIKIDRVV